MDTYRAAVACTVRTERYADAVAVLLRFAGACDRAGSHASLARCYLSAVVLFLAQGDPVGAQLGFDDYSAVPGFGRTDESRAAWELLDAYQQADPAAIRKAVGRGVFTGLEQCVIKLAKRLPVGDLKAQAAKLNATRGGGPSEDAAALQDDDLT